MKKDRNSEFYVGNKPFISRVSFFPPLGGTGLSTLKIWVKEFGLLNPATSRGYRYVWGEYRGELGALDGRGRD